MRPKTKRRDRTQRLERYLTLAGEAGSIAMSLRDKPTPLDWIGVALRAVGVLIKVNAERRGAIAKNPWNYFDDHAGELWTEVPTEFHRLIFENLAEVTIDEAYWDGDAGSAYLCRGVVGGEVVGWIGEGDAVVDGPYVLCAREAETYRALGERVWQRIGGRHVLFGNAGLVLDPFGVDDVRPTAQMRELETRMQRFLDAELARSYLFAGPPGTGKSLAIRWLVRRLGLGSVRIDLGVLARLHGYHGSQSVATSLETLLQLLRPEVMILDDLDRVAASGPLLHFLEIALRTCQIVMASANCTDKMMGAALRPGRFDEIVRVDRLDPEVLRGLLGDDADLCERLAPLPAAYVAEFVKRRRVLGKDAAIGEIADLERRCGIVAEKTEAENDA
ncbi:MAG: AAA family ATPase [Kofleriaceae bacterium]|nr:AAA family ATPase [Kofleriaceae bacterium]MCB9571752.1 AAA family ATPase [Kofleriaceae bacterium]